ncbi:MAG: family 16 glycosylhydrolase [Treponema sp.]|nr:family 16 glycosylhydrolase [Treponema sp.]
MKKLIAAAPFLAIAVLLLAGCSQKKEAIAPTTPAPGLQSDLYTDADLVWEENFDGDSLNMDNWKFETHEPGWVNAELQAYVTSPENTYVKDGCLVIQALKNKKTNEYTSGRINTFGKHVFKYGRFEARIKVPSGKGFLPAFWMMPSSEGYYGPWPRCGEIDIMEVLGDETNRAFGTIHYGEPHTQQQGKYTLTEGDFSKEFHVYAVEWDPGEFRWYVDGKLYYKTNEWFTRPRANGDGRPYPAPFNKHFYIILNLAVGGTWVGYPEKNAKFAENARLIVDYVRVYQKKFYDENVKMPEKKIVLREPDADGNFVRNSKFTEKEDMGDGAGWDFYTAGGGEGTATIGNGALTIKTKKAGSLEYSVQIFHVGIPIEKGCTYEFSFDAKASSPRTMLAAVSAPEHNWIRYFKDTKVELTKKEQHFSFNFTMKDDTDPMGRVEFNMGNQGSTADIVIKNVVVKKVE